MDEFSAALSLLKSFDRTGLDDELVDKVGKLLETELSLTGRFEILRLTHWTFAEMRDAFGLDLDQYIYFGGYPGSAPLIPEERRRSGEGRRAQNSRS